MGTITASAVRSDMLRDLIREASSWKPEHLHDGYARRVIVPSRQGGLTIDVVGYGDGDFTIFINEDVFAPEHYQGMPSPREYAIDDAARFIRSHDDDQ